MASNDPIIISDDEQPLDDVIWIDDDDISTPHVPTIAESVEILQSADNASTLVDIDDEPRPKKRRQTLPFDRLPNIHEMTQPMDQWTVAESTIKMPLIFSNRSSFFHDEASCVEYLWDVGVFYTEAPTCSKARCSRVMKLEVTLKRIRWRCTSRSCGTEQGIRRDTPFEGKKQEIHKLLLLYRMLLDNEPPMRLRSYTGLNARTISLLTEDLNELFLCDLASIPSK